MPALTVSAPSGVGRLPVNGGPNPTPPAWGTIDQKLVDIGTIVGTDAKPVDRRLCGPPDDLEALASTLPTGSLTGAIALVSRGYCTFASKVERAKAAGAAGVVFVDNRPGEAEWPGGAVQLGLPAVMIADADGAKLRAAATATAGRATIRVGRDPLEVQTGRGGTPMAFSSAGLTPFGHDLKPDLAAPGGAILSSTLKETVGEPFAVFDGTSMAAPHVSGAAALLLERHPNWSAAQLKSALMSTAGPAWGDTARTTEASVLVEGAGLIDVGRADTPLVFSEPESFSFHYLNVNHGPASRPLLATISDAGNGYGTWQVELQAQSATSGAMLDLPAQVTLSAGGDTLLTAVARASADAAAGDDYGFIVLRKGDATRRIPYEFTVERPGLESVTPVKLRSFQDGDTLSGADKASVYRWPTAPFGPAASYNGPPVDENGAEKLYVTDLTQPAVNIGVAVVGQSASSLIDPWFLGSRDENDVAGYTGTPVNVNSYLFHYRADVQAAGLQYPLQGRYYVAVDSGEQRVHRPLVRGAVPPAFLDQRRQPAAGDHDHDDDRSRAADDHRADAGPPGGRRPALARDRLRPHPGRRRGLRPGVRLRGLPAARFGRAPEGRQAADGLRRGRLPGGQERRPGGRHRDDPPEHHVPRPDPAGRAAADRAVALPGAERPASPPGNGCWSSRARRGRPARSSSASTAGRSRPTDLDRRALRRRLADDQARGRAAQAARAGHRRRRQAGGRHPLVKACRKSLVDERVAVITGGSSGIGAALARDLTRAGWRCVLVARGEERLRELAEEIGAEAEVCDVGDRAAVDALAARVIERHPRIKLLVNNAGIPARSDFISGDPERIENVIRVNYLGSVWCLRAFLPALEAAAPSDVVNVVSVAGTVTMPPSGPYAASKHAQLAFSRATAAQLRGRGVRVHTVLPGFAETEGFPQRGVIPKQLEWTVIGPERIARSIVGAVEPRPPGELRAVVLPPRRVGPGAACPRSSAGCSRAEATASAARSDPLDLPGAVDEHRASGSRPCRSR